LYYTVSEKASARDKISNLMHAVMRTKVFSLGLSKKLVVAGMITMLLSVSVLSTLTEHVLAAPDKFGIEQL
jgi:hypothetical protein